LGQAGLISGAQAEDVPPAAISRGAAMPTGGVQSASTLIDPELPPEDDNTPAVVSDQENAKPTAPPASEADAAPVTTDPEGVAATDMIPGAAPPDIAAAIAALPAGDVKRSPLAGLPNWSATRDALERFYIARGDMPLFTDDKGFSFAGKEVIQRLALAGDDGLDLSSFALPDPNATIDKPAELAANEITIAEAVIVYAFQASGGRVDPAHISPLITAKPEIVAPERALETVATAADKGAALANFNPPQKGYRELLMRLAELRAAYPDVDATWRNHAVKPEGAKARGASLIRPNFDIGSVEATTERPQYAATDAPRPDATAIARLDPSVSQALVGRSPRALEAAILANMEMWRWEPRDMGEERIEVNVADFTLRIFKGDEALHSAKIIVGKPDSQTPIFSNAMRYILVNPSWRVPPSIIRKEMLPKLAEDPDYLNRMGFEVTRHGDTISVTQPPGEKNALGHIAFMFPNQHSVYLHDTPSRSLFGAARRAFSHGCVRVDQPMRLAEFVMGGSWSEQRFRALIGGAERTVFLPHPLPIHIEYFTAFVDESGDLQIRDDLYGHMRRLESALGLDG
jgi:murein L,D-transpeptidase YcbB/YkuD